ncbi:hypothetical protein F1721_09690 [Saccharopolyspora hirsuta]|uniref:PIG-L family deacetylase n=1 Tax=Saccharopolyspora hirsuta TaxID=1837 RepID=A0A5M7BZE0_SACHI|nr:PIG-L family deacetylase [Saccharopolyspora hirsuta]KAA5835062.1 hypothetical protein F1721_09690 [Saccharopolyspora hirsuta]
MQDDSFRSGKLLLVSPHPDDIAYSCGGLVETRIDAAHLLTVFTRSEWTISEHLRDAGADALSEVRVAEDRRYCAERAIDHSFLDFADASLRGYDDEQELLARAEDDPLADEVAGKLAEVVRGVAPDLVIAPAAVGNHIDHLLVHLAVRALDGDHRTLYYEDIPYSAHHALKTVERELREVRGLRPFRTFDISAVIESKVEGMRVYRSQTDDQGVQDMRFHASRVAAPPGEFGERLWEAAD